MYLQTSRVEGGATANSSPWLIVYQREGHGGALKCLGLLDCRWGPSWCLLLESSLQLVCTGGTLESWAGVDEVYGTVHGIHSVSESSPSVHCGAGSRALGSLVQKLLNDLLAPQGGSGGTLGYV